MPIKNAVPARILLFVCITASLAGLLFGMDMGTLSGAFPHICQEFNLTGTSQGWVISIMMPGAMVGALSSGVLSRYVDRKYGLRLGGIIFILGIGGVALASSISQVIIFRFMTGIAIGLTSCITPAYLSEISPEHLRGRIVSLYQLMITAGILFGYLFDAALIQRDSWRWMIAISLFPAIIMFIGTLFLPASPRWLMVHGRNAEALTVLLSLRGNRQQAEEESTKICAGLLEKQNGWAFFTSNKFFRRAVYLAMLLQLMQQFTGISVVMYYAPKLFQLAGFTSANQQMWGSVIIGFCNVCATFLALALVDRWGRKPVLVSGFTVMALSMWGVGYLMYSGNTGLISQYSAIVLLMLFIIGFAMSIGPLAWVLCAEIQPLKGRDFGLTCSTATNWIANMTIGVLFIFMLEHVGGAVTFWAYAACNALFIILTIYLIPETRDIALETIEKNLLAGKPLRKIGR